MRKVLQPLEIALLGVLFFLSSCSYAYNIKTVFLGKNLVFTYDRPNGLFSRSSVCANYLTVTAESQLLGYDIDNSSNTGNSVWEIQAPLTDCYNLPIRFGSTPKGAIESVKAQPLHPGIVYHVSVSGLGAYGGGSFRLVRTTTIETVSEF